MIPNRNPNYGAIAMYIAAAMNHPVQFCDCSEMSSTITVEQHKVKFGQVRIYVKLADSTRVAALWINRRDDGSVKTYEEFVRNCFIHDARQYRQAYMSMKTILLPEEFEHVRATADYEEFLFESYEQILRYVENRANANVSWMNFYYVTANPIDVLCTICDIKKE